MPIKEEPRLELLGCLLLSKLIKSVCEAVGGVVRLSEIYCCCYLFIIVVQTLRFRCGGLNKHIKTGRYGFRTELM